MKIRGGYYLKAKCIMESEIMSQPPHVRETWDWLLMNAAYQDTKRLKRGQLLTSTTELRDNLSWKVGYRTMYYTKDSLKFAMKALRNLQAITTQKTPRGIVVTICNYEHYQNPKNYENSNEAANEAPNEAPNASPKESSAKAPPNIDKRKRKKKKEEVKEASLFGELPADENSQEEIDDDLVVLPDWLDKKIWADYLIMRVKIKKAATNAAMKLAIRQLTKFRDEGIDPNESLEQSILNSWQGVFEPKDRKLPDNLQQQAPDTWKALQKMKSQQ